MIPKSSGVGQRPLGIPTIRDRVVQTAAKLVLEPIFEADFDEAAYGYRRKRSALDAVRAVHKAINEGHTDVAFGLVQIEVVGDMPARDGEHVPFGHREPVEDQDCQRILSNQLSVAQLAERTPWLSHRVALTDAAEVGRIAGTFVLVAAPAQCLQVVGIVRSPFGPRHECDRRPAPALRAGSRRVRSALQHA